MSENTSSNVSFSTFDLLVTISCIWTVFNFGAMMTFMTGVLPAGLGGIIVWTMAIMGVLGILGFVVIIGFLLFTLAVFLVGRA